MTPRHLLAEAARQLSDCGCASPRLDAELLLCHVLQCPRSWLIAHADDALDSVHVRDFELLLARRKKREPVAYITGEKEFWSRCFDITPDVLIPRPETEHLIEAVLEAFPNRGAPYDFCDIGTGSGCIAVTLACEFPQARITAADISRSSLNIAQQNAAKYHVAARIDFNQGDMFAAFSEQSAAFDAIISNPPYVSNEEMHALAAELDFEPRNALTDESDGLKFLNVLVEQAVDWLKPNGLLIVETGLCGLPEGHGRFEKMQEIYDLAGHLRGGIYTRRS